MRNLPDIKYLLLTLTLLVSCGQDDDRAEYISEQYQDDETAGSDRQIVLNHHSEMRGKEGEIDLAKKNDVIGKTRRSKAEAIAAAKARAAERAKALAAARRSASRSSGHANTEDSSFVQKKSLLLAGLGATSSTLLALIGSKFLGSQDSTHSGGGLDGGGTHSGNDGGDDSTNSGGGGDGGDYSDLDSAGDDDELKQETEETPGGNKGVGTEQPSGKATTENSQKDKVLEQWPKWMWWYSQPAYPIRVKNQGIIVNPTSKTKPQQQFPSIAVDMLLKPFPSSIRLPNGTVISMDTNMTPAEVSWWFYQYQNFKHDSQRRTRSNDSSNRKVECIAGLNNASQADTLLADDTKLAKIRKSNEYDLVFLNMPDLVQKHKNESAYSFASSCWKHFCAYNEANNLYKEEDLLRAMLVFAYDNLGISQTNEKHFKSIKNFFDKEMQSMADAT